MTDAMKMIEELEELHGKSNKDPITFEVVDGEIMPWAAVGPTKADGCRVIIFRPEVIGEDPDPKKPTCISGAGIHFRLVEQLWNNRDLLLRLARAGIRAEKVVEALDDMVGLWDANNAEGERCGCAGASDDCPHPGPCEYCHARAILAAHKESPR